MKSLKNQQGVSVAGVVLTVIAIGLLAKFAIGVIPAYISDRQLTKLVIKELKKSNAAKHNEKQFFDGLNHQLSINASYNTKAKEIITFTNKTPGQFSIILKYEDEHLYYGNTYVVNRFEKTITAADAAAFNE